MTDDSFVGMVIGFLFVGTNIFWSGGTIIAIGIIALFGSVPVGIIFIIFGSCIVAMGIIQRNEGKKEKKTPENDAQ